MQRNIKIYFQMKGEWMVGAGQTKWMATKKISDGFCDQRLVA